MGVSTEDGASAELFPKIGEMVEDEEAAPMELSSLCINCEKQGVTKILMTEIPFFRQVILMSFRCEHCGFANSEIKPGAAVQPLGGCYALQLTETQDLQRQVVKSDTATVRLEELDFEIPPGKGVFTTVEGLFRSALDELRDSQPQRRLVAPEVADQVDEFIARLAMVLAGASFPLKLTIDDPSGNSFLENPNAPKADPKLTYRTYVRSAQVQQKLGLQPVEYELDDEQVAAENQREENAKNQFKATKKGGNVERDASGDSTVMEKEVYELPTPCPMCGTPGTSKSCLTDIPYFQEVVIMGFDCQNDDCNYKTNEIKGAGPIPPKGRLLGLSVKRKGSIPEQPRAFEMDMNRDVVKSNTAGVNIPELEIEITPGSLGGMYTTVEGLLTLAKSSLFESQASDFTQGDSVPEEKRKRWKELEERFEALLRGDLDFTLEIKDPLAASYIYSPDAPNPEPRLQVIDYERSFEDDEELGLNDINTENYQVLPNEPAGQKDVLPAVIEENEEHQVADSDDDIEFHGPFETFQGHRVNMVFRLGTKGLGYYRDVKKSHVSAHNVVERMRRVQADGDATHPNPNAVQEMNM
jgi:zinc finger protein